MISRSVVLVATVVVVASGCSQSADTPSQQVSSVESLVATVSSTETSAMPQSTSSATSSVLTITESSGAVSSELSSQTTEENVIASTTSTMNTQTEKTEDSSELSDEATETTTAMTGSAEKSLPEEEDVVSQVQSSETADLPMAALEYQATSELTAEMVALVHTAIDVCGEIPSFRCSMAVLNICDKARAHTENNKPIENQYQTDEQKALSEAESILCRAAYLAHVYEIGGVLSAKYSEEYYKRISYFSSFRNLVASGDYISLPKSGNRVGDALYGTERVFLISEATIKVLKPLTDTIRRFYDSAIYSIVNESDERISTILDQYSSEPESTLCISSASVFLDGQDNIEKQLEECIQRMCSDADTIVASICSPTQTIIYAPGYGLQTTILEKTDLAKIEIYWRMLPFICSNGTASNFSNPEDACRKMAVTIYNQLEDYQNYSGSFTRLDDIKTHAYALGKYLIAFPRVEARRNCYNAIADARSASSSSFKASDACYEELKVCEVDDSAFFDVVTETWVGEGWCEVMRRFYDLEILWRDLPSICQHTDTELTNFFETTCYDKIDSACGFYIEAVNRLPRDYEDRYDDEIGLAPCYISRSEYFRISGLSTSHSKIVKISDFAPPEVIIPEPVYSNLTFENLNSIMRTIDACGTAALKLAESECSSALWTSCYDLRSLASANEHPESDVSIMIDYLCSAAYIAELAELVAVLFSSFESTYNNGSFDEYRKFIASEIARKSAFAPMENGGIYASQELAENLSSNALALMKSVGNSLGGFVMPYLLVESSSAVNEIAA